MINMKKKEGFAPDRLLTPLLISVALSLGAGFVGALLVHSSVETPAPVLDTAATLRPALSVTRLEARRLETAESVTRTAVAIFKRKPAKELPDGAYLKAEAIGGGLVLTSDGWVVTHRSVLEAGGGAPLVALVGGEMHPVEDPITDPYSGAVFFRVPAGNLPVASLVDDPQTYRPGDQLFALGVYGGVRNLQVIAPAAALPDETADLLWDSESLNRFLLCTAEPLRPGSMVLNEDGKVLGLVAAERPAGLVVVPTSEFVDVVSEVFRNQEIPRPFLGVRFVDLAELLEPIDGVAEKEGAYLVGSTDGRLAAVLKGSPAAEANLRGGDVVVAVNEESVTDDKDLGRILSAYYPGATVTLGVKRRGADITVNVTLGEASE
jgi:S1-C subfamily serine protease